MAAKKDEKPKEEENEKEAPEKEEKSPDDRVTELEKKLGEVSDTINQQNEFIQGASVVINTLAYNPELRTKFQEVYQKQQGVVPQGQEPSQQQQQVPEKKDASGSKQGGDDELSRKVDEVAISRREEIVRNFEDKVGISKLKESERSEARKKLEGYFNRFGMSVKTNPLPSLQENLESAWVGTNVDKLREEGKLEGIASFRTNQQGEMGTLSGGVPESSGSEDKLSEKQRSWAEKLGVDASKAEKTYKSRIDEEKRVSGGEKRAKK